MIECICIDATGKPKEVHAGQWVQHGFKYHITHVYYHPLQGNMMACSLHEVRMDKKSAPYETYRLSRFAFTQDDWDKLVELSQACSELDKVDIIKILEANELEIIEK